MQIRQLIRTNPPHLRPEEPIVDAVTTLIASHENTLPVVADGGELVGVLRTRDVLPILLGRSTSGRQVHHFMEKRFLHFDPADSLQDACNAWVGGSSDSLVVVEDGRFVGLLRERDVVVLIPRLRRAA